MVPSSGLGGAVAAGLEGREDGGACAAYRVAPCEEGARRLQLERQEMAQLLSARVEQARKAELTVSRSRAKSENAKQEARCLLRCKAAPADWFMELVKSIVLVVVVRGN